jgi:two-component system CheB/CheR fusion protein
VTLLSGDYLQGYVKIARDLTGHKRAQDEQSQELAQTRNTISLRDEFFAVMSHELKHPLNLIQLNAELLRRLPVIRTAGPATKAVSTICDAVNSQARIIDDLLDVARVRTGKLKLQMARVDLTAVLRDIHTVVLNEQHATRVDLNLPPEALIIHADPTRVEQIIWNLVNNALKFATPPGQVQIIAARSGDMARLEVIDNGPGIAPEHQEHIFDLFGQGDTRHVSHQRDGLGIGLSLVRQLTHAHDGSVQVHSAGAGTGSTFTVLLPLSSHAVQAPGHDATTGNTGRLAQVKILLIDDSAQVLETMKLLLQLEQAQVSAFSDPLKALEEAKTHRYDVIISDIGMPVMDGHQLMRALRELPGSRRTPGIALTGYGAQADIQKTEASGFNRHLSKPVAYDALIAAIEDIHNPQGQAQ